MTTKIKIYAYGQETHQPILIIKGEARQAYKDFGRWLNALGIPTKEMKKNANTKTPIQNTTRMVRDKK